MLRKKQYFLSLLLGVIAFVLFFILMYWVMYFQMPHPEKVVTANESSTNTLMEMVEDAPRIEIYTKVTIQLVDERHKVVDKISVPTTALLGVTEEQLAKRFEGYQIAKFDEKEVILQKQVQTEKNVANYTLGICEGHVCIIDQSGEEASIDLGLLANDFSSKAYSLLLNREINISESQKDTLIKKPNEIQKILQGYERE